MTNSASSDGINTLNVPALQEYLVSIDAACGQIVLVDKFSGGQSNPTFLLECRDPDSRMVLRKQPPGELLKSAHAVDREYKVMHALTNSAVPVPEMIALCEDLSVLGEKFFLMEFLDGETYWDAALPELEKNERMPVYDAMVAVLAELATLDYKAAGLEQFGRPGNYYERQLKRWDSQYQQTAFRDISSMNWITAWLHEHMPEDDGRTSLVHGDFRLDNLKYAKGDKDDNGSSGEMKLIGVLDWELSTLGHPLADLANLCMQLRIPKGMANMSGLAGRNVVELGLPDEDEIVGLFVDKTGITFDNWRFYVAFGLFRIAAILQGVAKRAVDGNASNPAAIKLGEFVEPLADIAVDVARNG